MAEITVHTVELQAIRLTPRVLKQIPVLEVRDLRPALDEHSEFKPGAVLGWIHEEAHGKGYRPCLLVQLGRGQYGLFQVSPDRAKRWPQIYVA